MRLSKGSIATAFMLVYLSKILWYDLRIYSARGALGQVDTGLFFIIWAVLLLPFVCYFLLKIPPREFKRPIFLYYFFYVICSVVTGILYQNSFKELFGDVYKSAFIPAGIGLYFFCRRLNKDFETTLFIILAAYIFVRFLLFFSLVSSISQLYYGVIYDSIFMGLLFSSARHETRYFSFVFQKKFRLILGVFVILGQKRFVLGALIAFLGLRFNAWITILIFAIFSFTFLIFAGDIFEALSTTRIGRNLALTEILESEYRRVAEIQTGFNAWTSNLSTVMFGRGYGTSIEVYSLQDQYWETIYSIHNSQIATLVRSGLIGLTLMLLILGYGIRGLTQGQRRLESAILLSVFFSSLLIYTFMDEILVGYFLAAIWDKPDQTITVAHGDDGDASPAPA